MKRSVRVKTRPRVPSDLFVELGEGIEALAEALHGKRTLRTHAVEYKPPPTVTPQRLIRVRKDLKSSVPFSQSIGEPTSAPWRTGNRGALSRTRKPRC